MMSVSVSSSAPCTSLEVFQASFWTMCWPTPLRLARPSLTQLGVLLLDQAFAAIGSKVDVSPGSLSPLSTVFLLHFALHNTVGFTRVLCTAEAVTFNVPKYFHCHVNTFIPKYTAESNSSWELLFYIYIILKHWVSEVCLRNIIMSTEG